MNRVLIDREEITKLRDTGTCSDVISRKFISPNQLDGGVIWARQPLMNDLRCLPTADVILEIERIGNKNTKLIVADSNTDISYCILGDVKDN